MRTSLCFLMTPIVCGPAILEGKGTKKFLWKYDKEEMEKITWILQINHVLWRWILKMKRNTLFFTWQGREPNRREAGRFEKAKNSGRKMTFALWKKYEQGGNWFSDQRRVGKVCDFHYEINGLISFNLNQSQFRRRWFLWFRPGVGGMGHIYCEMILTTAVFCYSKMWSRFGKLGPVQRCSCKSLQVSCDWPSRGTVLHIPCESSEQCWH